MELHIIHQGFSVSSVSNRLLNQEISIEKGITFRYIPSIYAEGYILFVFPFVRSSIRTVFRSFVTFRRVSRTYVEILG